MCNTFFGQSVGTSTIKDVYTYKLKDNYLISRATKIYKDRLGWVWILGFSQQKSKQQFGSKEYIIQRYDGNNFYTLDVSHILDSECVEVDIFKKSDGNFYLILFKKQEVKVYVINYKTLETTKIVGFSEELKGINDVDHSINPENNEIHFFLNNFKGTKHYKLTKNNKLKYLRTIPLVNNYINHFDSGKKTEKGFLISLSDEKNLYFRNDSIFNIKLPKKEIQGKNKTLKFKLKFNNKVYFTFWDVNGYFQIDEKTLKFKKVDNPIDIESINIDKLVQDENENIITITKNNTNSTIKRYLKQNDTIVFKGSLTKSFNDMLLYDNITKELIITSANKLQHFYFNENYIKKYLTENSIRAIKQLDSDSFLVATEFNGWFTINTKTDIVKPFYHKKIDDKHPLNYSREIYESDNCYWSNYKGGLVSINKKTKEVKNFKSPIVVVNDIIKLKDTIYVSAIKKGKILKFDLSKNKYIGTLDIKNDAAINLETNGNHLYMATQTGLLVYDHKVIKKYTVKSDNLDDNDLLCVSYTKNKDVFVGTKSGTLYQFDPISKTFTTIYKSKSNESIVGIKSDDNNNLWLNTYLGVVKYNLTTRKSFRITEENGLSYNEGNRYSMYISEDGKVLAGTFKGLNVIYSKKINESNNHISPVFTSISLYSKAKNIIEKKHSPYYLETVSKVNLPPENRRFEATVGLLNYDLNKYLVQYRLKQGKKDIPWNTLRNSNKIEYANLEAGTYTLQVQMVNALNQKKGKDLELTIISEQFFYKTRWFIILLVLSLLIIGHYNFNQFKIQQKLNAENRIAINEAKIKEAMMLEIHHRIKNNLQIISGLLSLQALNSDNQELKDKLRDSQSRIESIASIHNVLYNSDNQESILVPTYFDNIINYNKNLYPLNVTYHLAIEAVILYMDTSIPLALILNELISNSYKHAFEHTEKPIISISFTEKEKYYLFSYSDNGTLKNKNTNKTSMGLRIIAMMNEQLKAKTYTDETKDSFNITLKVKKNEQP